MLRIQFDGMVIELGRDREPSTGSYLTAALPFVLNWLQKQGFASWSRTDSPGAPEKDAN